MSCAPAADGGRTWHDPVRLALGTWQVAGRHRFREVLHVPTHPPDRRARRGRLRRGDPRAPRRVAAPRRPASSSLGGRRAAWARPTSTQLKVSPHELRERQRRSPSAVHACRLKKGKTRPLHDEGPRLHLHRPPAGRRAHPDAVHRLRDVQARRRPHHAPLPAGHLISSAAIRHGTHLTRRSHTTRPAQQRGARAARSLLSRREVRLQAVEHDLGRQSGARRR